MKIGTEQHDVELIECGEVFKTYLVFDGDLEHVRHINGHDIIDEGAVVYKNGKRYEIFLYDFCNNVFMLEEVS